MNSDLSDIASGLTGSIASDGQTAMTGQLQGNSTGSAAAPSLTFSGSTDAGFYPAGSGNIGVAVGGANVATFGPVGLQFPIGMIIDFAGASAPPGWLLCNGQLISTTTYALLFAVVAYTYGGSGSSFRVPNTANRFPLSGVALNETGGSFTTSISQGNLPFCTFTGTASVSGANHNHSVSAGIVGGTTSTGVLAGGSFSAPISAANIAINNSGTLSMTGSATVNSGGSGSPFSVKPPYIGLNKLIFAGA